jgi:hypothetical protein
MMNGFVVSSEAEERYSVLRTTSFASTDGAAILLGPRNDESWVVPKKTGENCDACS